MQFNLHSNSLSFRSEIFLPCKFQIPLENAQLRLGFIAMLYFVKAACIYSHVLKGRGHEVTKHWKHKRLFPQNCTSACSTCNCVCLYLCTSCIHKHRFCKELGLIAVKMHLDFLTWYMFPFPVSKHSHKSTKYQTFWFSSECVSKLHQWKENSVGFFYYYFQFKWPFQMQKCWWVMLGVHKFFESDIWHTSLTATETFPQTSRSVCS